MTEPGAGATTSGYRVPLARPRARRMPARPPTRPWGWQLFGTLAILLGFTMMGLDQWLAGRHTAWGIVVGIVLLAATMGLLSRRAGRETTFDLRGLLLTSIGLRLICSVIRFQNPSDAVVYNNEGARLASSFRDLDFVHVDVGASVPGTGSVRYITGIAHLFTNSNFYGTTIIFTFMAFWASWFAYRAFETAVPSGVKVRYARFVFLWPSLCYWPSSIGKDAWMAITIAIAALGTAKLLRRLRGGYLLVGIGLFGAATVRPHVALLMFAAIVVAFLVGRRDDRRVPGSFSLGGITKVFGIVLLLVAGAVLAPQTAKFLKVDSLSASGVTSAFSATQSKTSEGSSAFVPPNPNSPVGYPMAVFTVFFRPLPGELRSLSGLAASLEGFALLLLTIVGWRRLVGAFHVLRSEPYVTFTVAYLLMFGYAFSAIANFGILTRERVQALPFFFVPLSLPKWHRAPRTRRTPRDLGPRMTVPSLRKV
ncbi:MAG TPA: hypothetical protein VMT43_09465 [Acidimicrobiales bacterium]|nr:hypothetical protein [Acidimicrobiales bacterium]